jgi:type I restriction enzyme, S subunit
MPPRDVIAGFETMLSPVDSRIEVTERKSRTLAAVRDTLLPKLLLGEIRVNPECSEHKSTIVREAGRR